MTELRRALRNMVLGGLVIGVVNFLAQIWFARRLGVNAIGEYGRITVVVGLVNVAVSVGVNQAVIGLGYNKQRQQNAMFVALLQMGAMALLLLGAGTVAMMMAPKSVAGLMPAYVLSGLGVLLLAPANVLTCGIEADLDYGLLSTMRTGSFLCSNVAGVILAGTGAGLVAISSRDFLNAAFYLAAATAVGLKRGGLGVRRDRETLLALGRFSRSIWLTNISTEGAKRIDVALAATFLGSSAFGIYFQTRALIDGALGFVLYPVQSVVFSFLRKYRDGMDFDKLRNGVFAVALAAAFVGAGAAWLLGPWLIKTLFGPKWGLGGPLLAPLTAYAVIAIYFEIQVSIAKARGRMRNVLAARAMAMTVTVIAAPILIRLLGLWGAGLATLSASLALALSLEFITRIFRRRPQLLAER